MGKKTNRHGKQDEYVSQHDHLVLLIVARTPRAVKSNGGTKRTFNSFRRESSHFAVLAADNSMLSHAESL